eukprot:gene28487-biopygen24091
MIDQMHVVDARRAGRHAGKAGRAAIDMPDNLLIGRTAIFQHVLDEIDAAARAVEFVAQRDIGRACGGAEPAMNAFAQDLFGFGNTGVKQLLRGEVGLHATLLQPCGRD